MCSSDLGGGGKGGGGKGKGDRDRGDRGFGGGKMGGGKGMPSDGQWTYGQGMQSRSSTKGGKDGGKDGGKGGFGKGGFGGGDEGQHSNIFVGNLAEGTTQADLEQNFMPFGTVASCMVTTKAGRTYGFVKFSTAAAAARAVNALNGSSGWLVKFANNDTGGAGGGKGGGKFGKGWDGGFGGKVAHCNVFVGNLMEGAKIGRAHV